jgi:hypothetical protein
VLWPVLLDAHPRDTTWSLGEQVSTRLRWLDTPDLPAELVVRQVGVRASALPGADGRPWAQLVEAGGLAAVREGHRAAGHLALDGCLGCDAFLPLIDGLPATVGTVRRVRVLHELHDRSPGGWVRRGCAPRMTDVPDAAPERLRDDPAPFDALDGEPGRMVILSPEEHFRLAYDRLPARQWQARGFLVDLETTGS